VLNTFLENKPLFYETIDYTRMPRIYSRIKTYFNLPKIVHIIGTNGKGTTGRFLATALVSLGFKVGHYTSPHILKFNERIWLNGANVSDALLEEYHTKLLQILTKQEAAALSYFEYTTLLAMLLYSDKSEYVILEAGLGGEYDATSVFDNVLTLVTPIDIDHEAFLGDTIEAIAQTKLNAIKKTAIVAKQKI
jgi:dihydrofolate synthase/folylpolyglutamate synthase